MTNPLTNFLPANKVSLEKKELGHLISKPLLFWSLLLLSLGQSHAQRSKIDSLESELSLHATYDTTRVNLLNELAFSYFSQDLITTLKYLDQSDSIADVIHFKKGQARSIYIRGITEAIQSNYDQALDYYDEALEWYKTANYQAGIANCYNAMGIALSYKGMPREAIFYFKEAIKIEEKIGGKNLSAPFINIGGLYQDLGEFDQAVFHLKKALAIAEANENEQRIAYSLNNLGTVYDKQGNYPLALEHYKQSMYMNEALGDSLGIVNNITNMGLIYQTQKNYDKAMKCYERALEIDEHNNKKKGICTALNLIGTIYEETGDYPSALSHYAKALRLSKEAGINTVIPYIHNNIGTTNLALKNYETAIQSFIEAKKSGLEIESKAAVSAAYIGLAKTYTTLKAYDIALNNALRAQEISEKSGFLEDQKEASEILSRIYEATGNYKNALESHQQFKLLNDSLFNQENFERVAQLEYEYMYKQQLDSANIRELKLTQTVLTTSQDLANSRQNYLWAIIGILILSIISGATMFYQKFNAIKARNRQIVTEQKLLRSQMTPHFIFNSLSVLQGMILSKEENKSITYLSKFSKLLRIVLENSRDKMVPLIQELEAIDIYMALQNIDADPSYDYSLVVDESIDSNLLLIPPMIIQPFIENAIEHAFGSSQEHCEIKVNLRWIGNELNCTITDNGIGIDTIVQKSGTRKNSLATIITSERLELLGKELRLPGTISIEDRKKYQAQGTQVSLIIPYKLVEHQ
ncbi:tetratricopeptide repeat-containing sensor histidine kinase [Reichenbachiella ulvae]|uniref:Tetratricopeptide repeat protein n=1 Tax=Reichenbachiella ulvae TaxID=2980104 RepID=A0ABT3CV19_9BACT|nr:tetratricopeptide repeat protein [Reichenbachiella ulvae]MCV9387398.1 tetratricopeptide repeat protein [Reichenbachiella ulvae]